MTMLVDDDAELTEDAVTDTKADPMRIQTDNNEAEISIHQTLLRRVTK